MARLQRPLPESGNLLGFVGLALKVELNLANWTPEERADMIARVQGLKTRADADAYMTEVAGKLSVAAATRKTERGTLYAAVAVAIDLVGRKQAVGESPPSDHEADRADRARAGE